jgi:hypothetical protein
MAYKIRRFVKIKYLIPYKDKVSGHTVVKDKRTGHYHRIHID